MVLCLAVFAFTLAIVRAWQLALILIATIPLLAIAMRFYMDTMIENFQIAMKFYRQAGAKAEEALTSIRAIKMLGGEQHEFEQYHTELKKILPMLVWRGVRLGLAFGLMYLVFFAQYPLGFYGGSRMIELEVYNQIMGRNYEATDVLVCVFSVLFCGFSLGQIQPSLKAFYQARVSCTKAFRIIDEAEGIISREENLRRQDSLERLPGSVRFSNVTFAYPSKRDRMVLSNFTLDVPNKSKVALVGESGCGKSTVCQLLEGFYYAQAGSITFGGEGINIERVSRHKIRKNIGYVGQEPILFPVSIRENMVIANPHATEEDIVDALQQAQAWEFVQELPQGMDTFVGQTGNSQLSGGQKQRIAIARALVKKPQILILDEATSALDRKNEQLIQETLDSVSKDRTTLIIAHRLTTIQNANNIVVMKDGHIVESGTHQELVSGETLYKQLVERQMKAQQEILEKEDEELQKQQEREKKLSKVVEGEEEIQQQQQQNPKEIDIQQSTPPQPPSSPNAGIWRILTYNGDNTHWLLLGILGSMLNGMIMPVSAILLGRALVLLVSIPTNGEYRSELNVLLLMYMGLGVVACLGQFISSLSWSQFGERLTIRIRSDTYLKYLYLPMSYFDVNSSGTLTANLAQKSTTIKGLTSDVMNIVFQALACFVTGVIISVYYTWSVFLLSLITMPFLMGAGSVNQRFRQGVAKDIMSDYKVQKQENLLLNNSASYITETAMNYKTIKAQNAEWFLLAKYNEEVRKPEKYINKSSLTAGLTYGVSQFIIYVNYAMLFYGGGLFYKDEPFDVRNHYYAAIFALVYAFMGVGQAFQQTPDLSAGRASAQMFFQLMLEKDEKQQDQETLAKYGWGENNMNIYITIFIKGPIPIRDNQIAINFNNVSFKYPTRETPVLQNFSVTVKPGEKLALVGQSGSGKTTLLQLLMKFYPVQEGSVEVGGVNVNQLTSQQLRRLFGVVGQEPILFKGTIEDNIKYNYDEATYDEICQAAKAANAIKFIKDGDSSIITNQQLSMFQKWNQRRTMMPYNLPLNSMMILNVILFFIGYYKKNTQNSKGRFLERCRCQR